MDDHLTQDQKERAWSWYCSHSSHVHNLYNKAHASYPPTDLEDKNNPAIWKASHWRWFLDNLENIEQ